MWPGLTFCTVCECAKSFPTYDLVFCLLANVKALPPLPLEYVVIEGNIGAGKTTLARLLHQRYGCELVLEQFADNPFLPLFYEDQDRYALMVELFFMTERHTQLTPLLTQPSLFSQPVLADYLFIKTWLFARQTLKPAERNLFKRLFDQLNKLLPLPQKLLFVHRPTPVLMANIAKRGRDYEQTISTEYLAKIQRTYWDYLRQEKRFPVIMIDAGELDFEHSPHLLDELSTIVATPYKPGLHVHTLGEARTE